MLIIHLQYCITPSYKCPCTAARKEIHGVIRLFGIFATSRLCIEKKLFHQSSKDLSNLRSTQVTDKNCYTIDTVQIIQQELCSYNHNHEQDKKINVYYSWVILSSTVEQTSFHGPDESPKSDSL